MILLPIAMALQLQAVQPADRAAARADSVAGARLVARARRAELLFILDWRREWERNRSLGATTAKFESLHCHYDDWPEQLRLHLIRSVSNSKSMCPIWHDRGDSTIADEAVTIDNALRPQGRAPIRKQRAAVLALLDSAAAAVPEDPWIVGQRVRLYVDQQELDRASAVVENDCHVAASFCALLAGYVLASRGDWHGATAAFEHAVEVMSDIDRCIYLDIKVFLDSDDRDRLDGASCAQRSEIDARFWWLADPLFMQPGNERLAVHLYRETLLRLHVALNPDERFDWRLRYGGTAPAEMVLRYGWPSVSYWDRTEDENHFSWLGYKDSSVNASREYLLPRYHTTPGYAAASDIAKLDPEEFGEMTPPRARDGRWDDRWWPIEHFARAGPLVSLDYQEVVLRRAAGPVIAVATRVPASIVPDAALARYTAGTVAMRRPNDEPRRATVKMTAASRRVAMSVEANPGLQVISTEVLDVNRDSAPAARARFSVNAPRGLDALAPREIAVSEAGLFAASDTDAALPRSLDEGLARMLPTSDLRGVRRVGVFFEVYGVASGEPLDLTLRVLQEDRPGFLRRIGGRLGIADAGQSSILLHWRDDYAGAASNAFMVGTEPVQWRSIIVDLSQVKPGHYALEIGVARPGESPVVSRRQLTIDR